MLTIKQTIESCNRLKSNLILSVLILFYFAISLSFFVKSFFVFLSLRLSLGFSFSASMCLPVSLSVSVSSFSVSIFQLSGTKKGQYIDETLLLYFYLSVSEPVIWRLAISPSRVQEKVGAG